MPQDYPKIDKDSDLINNLRVALSNYLPGRRLLEFADNTLPKINNLGLNPADIGNISPESQAARIVIRPSENELGSIKDLLRVSAPDPLNINQITKAPTIEPIPSKIFDKIGNFYNVIGSWKGDSTGFRKALGSKEYGRSLPSEEEVNNYLKMMNTVDPNKVTLYRTTSLKEVPKEVLLGDKDEFYSPGLSFSSNPKWLNQWVINKNPNLTDQHAMILRSGAKTLPIGGVGGYERELEHIAGGTFKVKHVMNFPNNSKILVLDQLDHTVHPPPEGIKGIEK